MSREINEVQDLFYFNIIASSFGHQNGYLECVFVGCDIVLYEDGWLRTLWMDALRPFSSLSSVGAAAAAATKKCNS
jgi:hypothetical protein